LHENDCKSEADLFIYKLKKSGGFDQKIIEVAIVKKSDKGWVVNFDHSGATQHIPLQSQNFLWGFLRPRGNF